MMEGEFQAIDGPFYAPNRVRRVRVDRLHDMPGFWKCTDLATGESLAVAFEKLIVKQPTTKKPEVESDENGS